MPNIGGQGSLSYSNNLILLTTSPIQFFSVLLDMASLVIQTIYITDSWLLWNSLGKSIEYIYIS